MIFYYIPITLLLLLLPFDFSFKKYRIFFIFLAAVITGTFAAFRGLGVDNDSIAYYDIFNTISKLNISELGEYSTNSIIEVGYVFINYSIAAIGGNYLALQILFAYATAGLFAYIAYKYSSYPFISILVYFSLFFLYRDFTQIRFGFSCLVSLLAIICYINGNFFKAFLLYFFASSVHTSSISILILIPIWHFRKEISIPVYVSLIIGSFFLSFMPLVDLTYKFIGLPDQLARYLLDTSGGNLKLAIFSVSVSAILLYLKRFSDTKYVSLYGVLLLISGLFGIIFKDFGILSRVQFLFATCMALAIPCAIKKFNSSLKLVFYFSFAFIFIVYYLNTVLLIDFIRPYEIYYNPVN